MPPIKVTLTGAGSAFAFATTADMLRAPELAGSTLALVDTDAEALDLTTRIARRMVEAAGGDLRIESTTDRTTVLAGSDCVLNSISVGEPWARERDVAIGEEYGIYQPTSQTVGPAGFMRGLRCIPPSVAIARDVAALCPEALLLDLANPMAPVCRAMVREAGVHVVGLCEAWHLSLPLFARALGVPEAELELTSVGTNHLGWAIALRHQGRDVLGHALSGDAARLADASYLRAAAPVASAIHDAYGLWPTGSEDHIAEWFAYFLTREHHGGADYGLSTRHTTDEQWQARWRERRELANGERPVDHLLRPSGESAVDIIAAYVGAAPPALHTVNLPNEGLIDGLPAHAIVELPAYISAGAARGVKIGRLPTAVTSVLNTRVAQQELMVDAALAGDREAALQGLLLDAQVTDLDVARQILDRSLEANAEWLPAFGR